MSKSCCGLHCHRKEQKPPKGEEPLPPSGSNWGRACAWSRQCREEVGRQEAPPLPRHRRARLSTSRALPSRGPRCAVLRYSELAAALPAPPRPVPRAGSRSAAPGPRLLGLDHSPLHRHHGKYRDVTGGRPRGARAGWTVGMGVPALSLFAGVGSRASLHP